MSRLVFFSPHLHSLFTLDNTHLNDNFSCSLHDHLTWKPPFHPLQVLAVEGPLLHSTVFCTLVYWTPLYYYSSSSHPYCSPTLDTSTTSTPTLHQASTTTTTSPPLHQASTNTSTSPWCTSPPLHQTTQWWRGPGVCQHFPFTSIES